MSQEKNAEESERSEEEKSEDKKAKPVRKRKKALYALIRKQMEFYFSDSNLAKDKFLAPIINQSEGGYIDLSVFLNFNKIRSFTRNIEDVKNALKASEILKLSEDLTCVKRLTPVQLLKNVDECTIYVENLPPHVNHDWIREIFDQFGKINYVSLPKFRNSKQCKGFAFVEFDNKDSVDSACKYFNASTGQSPMLSKEEQSSKEKPVKENTKMTSEGESQTSDSTKRKLEDEKSDDEEPQSKKRSKSDDNSKAETVESSGKLKEGKKAKQRKHKKKHKERNEADTLHLVIMSKMEWKRLKNKYLALQKASMAEVKKYLGLTQENERVVKKDDEKVDVAKAAAPATNILEFQPSVIIKINADKPFSNAKQIRTELKTLRGVAYIEIHDETTEGYIRCTNTEDTNELLKSAEHYGQAVILEGSEEKEYWNRLTTERQLKLSSKAKPKQRGTNKIIQKASRTMEISSSKHVRFDD